MEALLGNAFKVAGDKKELTMNEKIDLMRANTERAKERDKQ